MNYILSIPGSADDFNELRVLQWHATPGDQLELNQLLVELETHKAIVEVRSAQIATMRQLLCAEGEWGSPGRPLAILSDTPDEALNEQSANQMPATFEIC